MRTRVQISSSRIKEAGLAHIPLIPALGDQRQEEGSGVSWSASLADAVSSRVSETPCLKNGGEEKQRQTLLPTSCPHPFVSVFLHACVLRTHVTTYHTCTGTHTHNIRKSSSSSDQVTRCSLALWSQRGQFSCDDPSTG